MTPNLNRNLKFNPNFVKEIDTAFTKRSKANTYTGTDSNYETKLEFFFKLLIGKHLKQVTQLFYAPQIVNWIQKNLKAIIR